MKCNPLQWKKMKQELKFLSGLTYYHCTSHHARIWQLAVIVGLWQHQTCQIYGAISLSLNSIKTFTAYKLHFNSPVSTSCLRLQFAHVQKLQGFKRDVTAHTFLVYLLVVSHPTVFHDTFQPGSGPGLREPWLLVPVPTHWTLLGSAVDECSESDPNGHRPTPSVAHSCQRTMHKTKRLIASKNCN